MQAKFFNSLKCNQNVETFDSANSSRSDIIENSDKLENKLISEEKEEDEEEEISPLKESTYNNCKYYIQ